MSIPQVPVCQVSHAVEHVVDRIDVVCLSLKGPPMDGAGVVCLRGRCLAGFLALGENLSDVGVVCFHAVSLQGQGSGRGQRVPPSQLVTKAW